MPAVLPSRLRTLCQPLPGLLVVFAPGLPLAPSSQSCLRGSTGPFACLAMHLPVTGDILVPPCHLPLFCCLLLLTLQRPCRGRELVLLAIEGEPLSPSVTGARPLTVLQICPVVLLLIFRGVVWCIRGGVRVRKQTSEVRRAGSSQIGKPGFFCTISGRSYSRGFYISTHRHWSW